VEQPDFFDLPNTLLRQPREYPGKITTVPKEIVYLMGCGGLKQFCSTLRGLIAPEQYCPFCHIERERRQRKFERTEVGWGLLENEFKREGKNHEMWIIVPFEHITTVDELTSRDWESIGKLFGYCTNRYCFSGGLVMRYGDPHYHAGTVEHLHANIITPVAGVDFPNPLAKDEAHHAKNYQRMLDFRDEVVEQGGIEWLFSEDGLRETQL